MGLKDCKVDASSDGVLYVLDIDVDNRPIVKIGVTTRKVEDRIVEILTSYWKQYRVFPRCYPKRFKKTVKIYTKEQQLLKYFSDRKYESEKKFSGCQELLDVPLEEVINVYEKVIKEELIDDKVEITES